MGVPSNRRGVTKSFRRYFRRVRSFLCQKNSSDLVSGPGSGLRTSSSVYTFAFGEGENGSSAHHDGLAYDLASESAILDRRSTSEPPIAVVIAQSRSQPCLSSPQNGPGFGEGEDFKIGHSYATANGCSKSPSKTLSQRAQRKRLKKLERQLEKEAKRSEIDDLIGLNKCCGQCRCTIQLCCKHAAMPSTSKHICAVDLSRAAGRNCLSGAMTSTNDSKPKNHGEVGHTCRGSINLQGAFIHTEDSYKFIVSNGGTHTFHLKAASEVERQKWVTALELARVRAIKEAESDEEEELKMNQNGSAQQEKTELQATLRALQTKLEDLTTCQDLIVKHASHVQRSLADLEQFQAQPETLTARVKAVNERATLFRITTNAVVNACSEFVQLANSHGKKWQRVLQHEHEQRVRLQETLEQLARQHAALERASCIEHGTPSSRLAIQSDEEAEFYDAMEEAGDDMQYFHTARNRSHKRTGSEHSEAGGNDHDSDKGEMSENGARDGSNLFPVINHAQFVTVTSTDESANNAAGFATEILDVGLRTPPLASNKPKRKRRAAISPKPNTSLSLWSIMKNCIGKELSRIPVPVNFNEPLSMLQRLTEDVEYSSILDRAREMQDSCEQLCYVAAFTVSSYSTTTMRTGKPFNPLLGETYECDRTDDLGWRSVTEQVSHHPPAAAMHVEGKGWNLWQEFTMSSKFRGKYLQIIPLGISHLDFAQSNNHYTWRKVVTTVHNIIVGKLWVDNHGEMVIENHKTGDKCHLKYVAYSYFSRETPRKVTGVVTNSAGAVKWVIQGTWDDYIECAKVVGQSTKDQSKPVFETLPPKIIWKKNTPVPGADAFYNFTKLAIELNEPEEGVAPTDSRLRPDQRLHEEGRWDEANLEKVRIEDKQRAVRRQREAEAEQFIAEGKPYKDYEPLWFSKQKDEWTGNLIHIFKGDYWERKEKQNWDGCPDIF